MACNCKNTITSFLGGDVPNPTTFLNCGEADGTYNNPLSTGKTQCVAEDNVLRILDEYYVSGTVKNAGQIIFERTYTADTENWDEWNNSGDGYFKPILSGNWNLSASSLTTSSNITAAGNITTGTHDGLDFLYINRYNSTLPYAHIYSDRLDNNVESGFRFLTRNSSGTGQEALVIQGSDRKTTFQGNVVISGTNTTLDTLSAKTAINVGNGNGIVSANTFTAPQISIGKELGVITGTTIVGKYSGVTIANGTDQTIQMETATFRPGSLIQVDMSTGSGDITLILPDVNEWFFGKYTFTFPMVPNANGNFVLRATSGTLEGVTIAIDGNEAITNATRITFATGRTFRGTKIEVISSSVGETQMTYVTTIATKAQVTPS